MRLLKVSGVVVRPGPPGNPADAGLPDEYLDELERQIIGAELPPESRIRIWERLKAIRQARSARGTPGREQQAS